MIKGKCSALFHRRCERRAEGLYQSSAAARALTPRPTSCLPSIHRTTYNLIFNFVTCNYYQYIVQIKAYLFIYKHYFVFAPRTNIKSTLCFYNVNVGASGRI